MGQLFQSRRFQTPVTEAPAGRETLASLMDQLRKSEFARAELQKDHSVLIAHAAELLDRCGRLQVRLDRLEDPNGYHEDQVAQWLKSRGWLVSRPITIDGVAT
jgi:hypothetical protein